ncbi:hypothetical protein TNCV_4273701 [Trichonephila clavipes]|nr:hypothetical protein TNCV_4273701 [Trichonephila clavipes]
MKIMIENWVASIKSLRSTVLGHYSGEVEVLLDKELFWERSNPCRFGSRKNTKGTLDPIQDVQRVFSDVSECGNIKVALFSYSRAFGDRLRNLNHGQVMRMTPELAPSLFFHTTPTGGRLIIDRLNAHQPLLHVGSSATQGSNSWHTDHESEALTTKPLRLPRCFGSKPSGTKSIKQCFVRKAEYSSLSVRLLATGALSFPIVEPSRADEEEGKVFGREMAKTGLRLRGT